MDTLPSADAVLELMLEDLPSLDVERVPLSAARGALLREEIQADRDLPPFTRSAFDGYAIRHDDPSERFRIVDEVQAGQTPRCVVRTGECARIFTGAILPEGTTQVLMQEEVRVEGTEAIPGSRNGPTGVRLQGEDARAGDILISPGCRLTAAELSVMAGVGATQPLVSQPLRVVHWVTGNEIVPPDQTPIGSQIRDSNSILIEALLTEQGARLVHQGHLPDNLEKTIATLKTYTDEEADLILLSGGASVGNYDFGRPALEALGFEIKVQKVNLRPGKPLVFAARGKQRALVIPGNPVSHFVLYHTFIAPLIAAWEGIPLENRKMSGKLAGDFWYQANPRATAWPAKVRWRHDHWEIHPLRWMSSGDLRSLIGCNAFLHLDRHSGMLKSGITLEFLPTFLLK